MRRLIAAATAVAALALLTGCSPAMNREAPVEATEAYAPAMEEAKMAGDAAAPAAAPEAPPADGGPPVAPGQPGTPLGMPMLAYEYSVGLELPSQQVTPVMKAHEKACRDAGPALCQVLNAATNSYGDDQVNANLQLRAEPRWLEKFREGLEGQAKAANGRIKASNVSAEDLTRQIVDTEANLRAQKTLRERLQELLRSRPGKLSDLLETERELARVQQQIDSAESLLSVMRARVSMSILNLGYETKPNPVTGGTFEPIADALNSFVGNVAYGIAGFITFISFLLPWLIVIVPGVWLIRRWLIARAAKRAAKAQG
jgi:hypothetical protein